MATNSITGRFRDIEVSFSANGPQILMSLENLAADERRVRVMYQRLPISGRANWRDFHLTDEKESDVMPTDVMQAYRLTFFVDDYEPISTHIEKIVEELERLKSEMPAPAPEPEPEPIAPVEAKQASVPEPVEEEEEAQVAEVPAESTVTASAVPPPQVGRGTPVLRHEPSEEVAQQVAASPASVPEEVPESQPASEPVKAVEPPAAPRIQPPAVQVNETSVKSTVVNPLDALPDTHLGFQIRVPSLPPSAIAARKKASAVVSIGATLPDASMQKGGIFGNLAQALGISAGGRRNKAYYREEGERIQNELHDRIAKLEKDYEDGCGLVLENWDMETLSQEETAVFLLNLMVNEIAAWRKEAKPDALVETLADIEAQLKQTLQQTRGASVPSPTVFAAGPVADNERDLEKIRNDCNGYIQRFTEKLANLEKKHAAKVEILPFKKFLVEFVRDVLFLNVAKCTHPEPMPKRLSWFLKLMAYEVMPIETGVTKVSSQHHKLKGSRNSEFETGTIIEIVTPGLQSADGKRVIQTAVVIQSQ